jgi:hypothetical protein
MEYVTDEELRRDIISAIHYSSLLRHLVLRDIVVVKFRCAQKTDDNWGEIIGLGQ